MSEADYIKITVRMNLTSLAVVGRSPDPRLPKKADEFMEWVCKRYDYTRQDWEQKNKEVKSEPNLFWADNYVQVLRLTKPV